MDLDSKLTTLERDYRSDWNSVSYYDARLKELTETRDRTLELARRKTGEYLACLLEMLKRKINEGKTIERICLGTFSRREPTFSPIVLEIEVSYKVFLTETGTLVNLRLAETPAETPHRIYLGSDFSEFDRLYQKDIIPKLEELIKG